jgi:hypothetical protein
MFQRRGHVPFNAGFLATIRAAFPKEDLYFYGGEAHIEELMNQLGQPLAHSIFWNEIDPVSPALTYSKRFFRELLILRHLYKILSHDADPILVLTSAFPSTVLALKILRCFQGNNPRVQVVLHGLSGVVGKRYRHPIRRFQDMNTALTLLGNKNIQYLVLERSIRDTIIKSLPHLSGNIEVLDHPISPNESTTQKVDFCQPIRFGFLGLTSKAKGYPLFVKLAGEITERYGRCAEFHVIGHFSGDDREVNDLRGLATKPAVMQMTRADFIRGLSLLHFVILPHEAASYATTASGVLLDAIAWEKPVIARKMPIFEAMFEKHGDIGYLFHDDADLMCIVEQILQTFDWQLRYRNQVMNIRMVRKSRDPEILAAAYREICSKVSGGEG